MSAPGSNAFTNLPANFPACTSAIARQIAADIEKEEKLAGFSTYRRKMAALSASQAETAAPLPEFYVNQGYGPKGAPENAPKPAIAPLWSAEDVARLSWYDEQGYFPGPEVAAEISDEDRAFAMSANGHYLQLCKEATGDFIEGEDLTKRQRESAELLELTEQLCAKMKQAADPEALRVILDEMENAAAAAGADGKEARKAFEPLAREIAPRFEPYRINSEFELRRYFGHSRQVDILPMYRRIRFLPYVAQMLRGPMLAALEHWLSKNPFARFWTFTSGPRVKLTDSGARARWLAKRIRKLNRQRFMKEAGVEIVFRSTELGTPSVDEHGNKVAGDEIERGPDGEIYLHVHAHCVVALNGGYIPPEKWEKLLEKVHRFWGFNWSEDGQIQKAREVCKYVTKPTEMLKLSAEELVELEQQLSHLHLVQASGSLGTEIKERTAKRKRLVRKKTKDGRIYIAVENWNLHARRSKTEEAQDRAGKLTPKEARGSVRVVSRGTPRFNAQGVAEPVFTVMCKRGSWDENAVRSHPLIAPIIRNTWQEYQAGLLRRAAFLSINVHTRTVTFPTPHSGPNRKPRGKPKKHRIGAERAGY